MRSTSPPGTLTEHSIFTCAECPLCEEGPVEGDFYCEHPNRPDDARERLAIFDGVPAWCPVRTRPLVIRIGE